MNKAPAFQFYPKDYTSDEHVVLMSLEQEGAYLRLMCHQWLHGSIPSELSQIAAICRTTPAKMKKLWAGIEPCFPSTEDGRRANRRMSKDNEDMQRWREARAEAGAAGGRAKAAKQTASTAMPVATVLPVAKPASPFSVLQSATATTRTSEGALVPASPANATNVPPIEGPKPNPWVQGKRGAFEREAMELTEKVAALMDLDPPEVFRKAAGYDGARKSGSPNPANLSDDRLLNTVMDLRRMLKQAQERAADKARHGNV